MKKKTQLDRIEAMLKELVQESRARRVIAERDSYNESMQHSYGMSTEDHVSAEKAHQDRCDAIMRGEA